MSSTNHGPWYQRIHRWGQTNLTEDDPVKCDLDFWRDQWRKTRIQGVIVNCGGIVAYYPSRFGLQYRARFLGDRDFFKEFSDAARAEGLAVVARMDINRATEEFFDAHPDWFCRDKEGRPLLSNGRYYSCVNSGYYKEFIPAVLEEIIEKYHPAGFADNSWKGLARKHICYCENCRKKFQQERGLALPEAVSWEDPVYREWIRWSYACRLENWDLFNATTQRAGGADCLWLGMFPSDPANPTGNFCDLKGILERSKIIFCDHQSRDPLNGFEQNSVNGALLRLASDEAVPAAESWACYVRGSRSFRLAANPAPETRMWMIEGIAGGISPWFHHVGGSLNDRRQYDIPVPLFQWHAANEPYLYNRESLANVGLVWNQANTDFYGRDDARERVALPWRGFCLALTRARIPFLPINAADIERYRHRMQTMILPDLAILSADQIDAICRFVETGGNLILTGITATLDGDGDPSPNDKLWRLLGLKLSGDKAGAFGKVNTEWEFCSTHTYLKLPETRHEILAGFEATNIIPFGGGLQLAESTGSLKPIASYVPEFPIYPPEFSWIREERPDIASIFAGTLPGGSRAVYFPSDIDRCYGRENLPDHGDLLANAIRWAAGDTLPIRVQGPGFIDCKLYRQDGRAIIHLVNLSGSNRNPGYLDELLPIGPVTVAVKVEKAAKALLRVAGGEAPLRFDHGQANIKIDRILDHELIVLE